MTDSTFTLIAATFTPMTRDRMVDLSLIGRYGDYLSKNDVSGVFVCGTTGEGKLLTTKERRNIAEEWMHVAAGRFDVIVHVGHDSVEDAKELARHAQSIGAAGIAASTTTYHRPYDVSFLVDYCASVADAAGSTDFYYYHVPIITKSSISALSFLQHATAAIPSFRGIKYTSEDLHELALCSELAGTDQRLYFGRDEMLLPALTLPIQGAVGSTYNFASGLFLRLVRAFRSGQMEEARSLQSKINQLVYTFKRDPVRVEARLKSIMKAIGIDMGPVRQPLAPIDQDQYEQFVRELRSIGFFGYCNCE